MAGSVNKIILVGNLGADPECRNLNSGNLVVNFNVATSESWRDKQTGERRERVEWHRVVIFNEGLAKIAEQYLHKGSKIYLEGQSKTRKWQDQTGADRYTTEVVLQGYNATLTMLDKRPSGPGQPGGPGDYGQGDALPDDQTNEGSGQASLPIDDEIPF